jgi:hypothetical protein
MSDRVKHCPFLNRADARCSSHFSLGHLSDALGQCFDQYAGCGVYRELLLERRQRRGELPGQRDPRAATSDGANWQQDPSNPHGSPFVPLTLGAAAGGRRYAGGR